MTVVSRSLVALLAIAGVAAAQPSSQAAAQAQFEIGRASCRERVCLAV